MTDDPITTPEPQDPTGPITIPEYPDDEPEDRPDDDDDDQQSTTRGDWDAEPHHRRHGLHRVMLP